MNSPNPQTQTSEPDDIVVMGRTPRYNAAVDDVLGTEGGFVDDPVDHGGPTSFGISLRFLAAEGAFDSDHDGKADFDLDMDGDIDGRDIRQLTRGDAKFLYQRCFWNVLDADRLPKPIGEMLFDQAVNGGISAARKLLQRAINHSLMSAPKGLNAPAPLKVDGRFGDASQAAMNWVLRNPALGVSALTEDFRSAVRERYRDIVRRYPSQNRFLRGWLARAERLGR